MSDLLNLCEQKNCNELVEPGYDYCVEHHEHYFCECGNSLGEYAGEGFCPRCR